jgi:hypothetical protein
MLETYFSAPKTLRRLRGGISGPHVDAFADDLERKGYAPSSAVRYIRAASHLGCFVQRKGGVLKDIDLTILDSFRSHLRRCRCPHFKRGKISYHAQFGVKLFHHHLVGRGVCPPRSVPNLAPHPPLVIAFCDWFRTHRGVKEPTLQQYARGATDLVQTLGENVGQWNAQAIRDFLLERASKCGTPTTWALITSLRAFLRFLNFRGESRDDLALAIPAVAHWRLARLPHCLSAEEVDRLIDACNGTDPKRLRDRAILIDAGAIRFALGRCGASPSHRHRLEQRRFAGNGERTIPSAVAPPPRCWRCVAPLSGMPAHKHRYRSRVYSKRRSLQAVCFRGWCLVRGETSSQTRQHRFSRQGCASAAPHSGHRDVAEWRALGSSRPRPPSP